MNLVNQSEFSRIIEKETGTKISRQAINDAMTRGKIPYVLDGKKKLIDLDDEVVQLYIYDENLKRAPVKPSKLPSKKKPKTKSTSKKQTKKFPEFPDVAKLEELDITEMRRRQQFADMRRKELQVLILEKKYLPIEFIDGVYIKYIESLNSNIERLASTFVSDVGKKILEAGEILPEHIEMFTNLVLEAIHNNKKTVKRVVQKYDPSV